MAMQDSDNLIVGRGNASYKISYEDFVDGLPTPVPPIPPLQVGKGVITPDTGVKEGDDLTGSATVINGENPIVIHCWEQDGVETVGTNHYTAQVGTIRYRQKVTDDNNQDPVVGEWSDPVVAEEIPPEPDTPNADMNGLRFDSARKQNFTGSIGSNVFTVSFWIKKVATDRARFLAQVPDGTYIDSAVNGSIRLGNSGQELVRSSTVPQDLVWTHVVVSHDGNESYIYLNGVPTKGIGVSSLTWNGASLQIGSAGTAYSDTYMSDYYYVDGKIAPPETFGKFFPGDRWGPLDSSNVQQNLDNLQPADPTPEPGPGAAGQPYDDRANTDQVWSDGLTGTLDNTPANAFNADTSVTCQGAVEFSNDP